MTRTRRPALITALTTALITVATALAALIADPSYAEAGLGAPVVVADIGVGPFPVDLGRSVQVFDGTGVKLDRFDGDFTENDALAMGDVKGLGGVDEILIAGDETGIVDIFDPAGLPRGSFNAGFTANDGFAVGNVDGFVGDEIVVAGDETGIVDIFNANGQKLSSFDGAFTSGDGFAVGDVTGDGRADIIVAGDQTHIVDVFGFSGQHEVPSFDGDFTEDDGLTVGDVDGDGVDEIIIGGDVSHVIDIFGADGQHKLPSFDGDFTEGDFLAAGDVNADGSDEILILGDETQTVDVFNGQGTQLGSFSAVLDPLLSSFFAVPAGFAVGKNSYPDQDRDGLLDSWETAGAVDVDGDGTSDVAIPGANPLHKDLFLELDWNVGDQPRRPAVQAVKAAFAAAPIDAGGYPNPDGQPGINIWIDTGGLVDPAAQEGVPSGTCRDGLDNGGDGLIDGSDTDCRDLDGSVEDPGPGTCTNGSDDDADGLVDGADSDCLVGDNLGGGNQLATNACGIDDGAFYTAKNAPNFNAARAGIFRYAISGNRAAGCGTGGQGEIGGNDFIEYNHNGATIMHELGHNLNLRHGGHSDHNCKPNYVSVMNYDDQVIGGTPQVGGGSIIDYSPPRTAAGRADAPLATIEEDFLVESSSFTWGANDSSNMVIFVDANGNKVRSPANLPPDWNGNGVIDEGSAFAVNVDTVGPNGQPAACANSDTDTVIHGSNDWSHISIPFRQFGDSGDAAIDPSDYFEPTLADQALALEQLNTTDLAVTIGDVPDPAVAGDTLTYTVTVVNHGPNPADQVRLVQTLPASVTFLNSNAGCAQAPAGTLTCDLGFLLAHVSRTVEVTVRIAADLVYKAGGPTTISSTATADNVAGPDLNPANDSDVEQTLVVAVADLDIVSFAPASALPQFLVGQDVALTLKKLITNHGPSAPMDVALSQTAAASAGVTVTPSNLSTTEPAVGLEEKRAVLEGFTVRCLEPSHHQLTFTNHIQPQHPADNDPNPANNTATLALPIECVLPVAINIKPKEFPNSINLDETSVPLAVLTTKAGEYGTPFDFDAASIDPLSVRFGTKDLVLAGGGASEIHDQGHLERSYELDERTKDADLDMVLHFRAADTGLQPGDTQACVRGQWTDAANHQHEFFGCDSVRVVPG